MSKTKFVKCIFGPVKSRKNQLSLLRVTPGREVKRSLTVSVLYEVRCKLVLTSTPLSCTKHIWSTPYWGYKRQTACPKSESICSFLPGAQGQYHGPPLPQNLCKLPKSYGIPTPSTIALYNSLWILSMLNCNSIISLEDCVLFKIWFQFHPETLPRYQAPERPLISAEGVF